MTAATPASAAAGQARTMVRVAAAGDLHLSPNSPRWFRNTFETAVKHADMLLVAGDLTASGRLAEAQLAVRDLRNLGRPVIVVLPVICTNRGRWLQASDIRSHWWQGLRS